MKRVGILLSLLTFSSVLMAKPSYIPRGGQGYLFPDANSFNNSAQFSLNQGFTVQGSYTGATESQVKTVAPSMAWGNGKVGLGAGASRTGTSMTDKLGSFDMATAGAGVALGQGRVTVGGTYWRVLEEAPLDLSGVDASITLNPNKGMGFAMGVGMSSTLGQTTNVQGARGSIGWGFKPNVNLEASVLFADIKRSADYDLVGAFTWGNQSVFLGALYDYNSTTKHHSAGGRMGVIIGGVADVSGHVMKTFVTGSSTTYGGDLRFAF